MANRINLNGTSYHGAGAIAEIANEAKAHAFKKAFVCSDPDLIKFNVTSKVTDVLEKEGLEYVLYYKYVKEKHNKRQAMKENKFFAETFRMEEYGIFSGYGTTVYI